MFGVMPPEPPPVTSEADYANSSSQGGRKQVANVIATSDVAFYGLDLPIPAHLLGREKTPELNKAVAAVLSESDESIPKRGYNDFHRYEYATADDIRMHVAQKIGKHGLSYEQHEVGYTPFGSLIAVHYYFVLTHASGETAPPQRVSVLTMMVTNNGKPDDKAFSKACVLALKDWSKGRFSIATGEMADDPDHVPAPQQQAQRPPPRTPARPASDQAFRNAGLPPKVEPASNGHAPDTYIAETGELVDTWLPDTLYALNNTPDTTTWKHVLEQALIEAPTMGSVDQICTVDPVIQALAKAPVKVKQEIRGWISAARSRLLMEPPAEPDADATVDAAVEAAS